MEFIGSKDGRMFVVDQIGQIKVMTADGNLLEKPFLNLSDRMVKLTPGYDERGLMGLALHPDFARNGRVFVFYSAPLRSGAPEGWSCTNRLSEFQVSKDNQNTIDMNSEKVLFQIDKPQMNHNGGTIAFGPDGYLYLPFFGRRRNDVGGHVSGGNAQDTSTLLGDLRIAVNNASAAYGIPVDNPFINEKGFFPILCYGPANPTGFPLILQVVSLWPTPGRTSGKKWTSSAKEETMAGISEKGLTASTPIARKSRLPAAPT